MLDSLKELLSEFGLWIVDAFFNLVVVLLSLIPVPDFLLNLASYTMPSSVSYYAEMFELELGLTIIVAAYVARFTLRRIPIIG